MKKFILLSICLLFLQIAYAQDDVQETHLSSQKGETTFGLGLGLPYGGIGLRLGTNIIDHLNLFGGLGYQISGVGYNIGLRKDFKSSNMAQFYLTAMYGTNAAIKVKGLPSYDKVYSGASFGLGVKINSRSKEGNYWDLGLLLPLRSSRYLDDEKAVRTDPRITGFTAPWPVLIVVGYNFNL